MNTARSSDGRVPATGGRAAYLLHAPSYLRLMIALLLGACAITLPLTGCRGGAGTENQVIVTGSTTMLPIMEVAGEMYHEEYPEISVLVSGMGSSAGIENVSKQTADIGTSSRDLKAEEETLGLVDTPVAYDAIAVIVHPDNPVDGLSREQVKAIFQGKITNWSEVGGPDMQIGLVNRDEASGTREAFSKIVLDKEPFEKTAVILPGTGQVRMVVGESPGAIGYISLGFVNEEVKAIAVEGVQPSVEAVVAGQYPLQRLLHVFTLGEPTGETKAFIDYVLSPAVQEEVVRDAGFIPVTAKAVADG